MRFTALPARLILAFITLVFVTAGCSHHAPVPASPAAPPPPFQYMGAWGEQGTEPGTLNKPLGLAVDAEGDIYIANSGASSIEKFSFDGHPLLSFQDAVPPELNRIAVDRDGGIYAASPRWNNIAVFRGVGQLFRRLTLSAPGIERARNIAVAPSGEIFVIECSRDSAHCQIQKYNADGRLLKSWRLEPRSDGEIPAPSGIGIGDDFSIYVVDATGQNLQKFDFDGTFISQWNWKSGAAPPSELLPSVSGIGVTPAGIVVAAPDNRGVRVWALNGQQKLADNLGGKLQSSSEYQIAANPKGELDLLDITQARILRFHMNF